MPSGEPDKQNIEVRIPFEHHHEPSVFLPFAKVVAMRKREKGLGLRVLLRVDSLHDRVALKRLGELDHCLHYIRIADLLGQRRIVWNVEQDLVANVFFLCVFVVQA